MKRFMLVSAFLFSTSGMGQPQVKLTERVIPLFGENVFPEGIAIDRRSGDVFVGSAADGSIQIVKNGQATLFQEAGRDGRTKTLGMHVDSARGRLFVASGDGVYVYDLSKNTLLKRNLLTAIGHWEKSAINDIAIDAEGNAYVTDSFNPHILKISASTFEMSVFADVSQIPFGNQNDSPYNLNGIVISGDQKKLLMMKTNDGALWELDIAGKGLREVKVSSPLLNGDGLVWFGEELIVVRNFVNKVSVVHFGRDGVGLVTDLELSSIMVPTTAIIVPGKVNQLMIVNSQFGVETVQNPFWLTTVSLP